MSTAATQAPAQDKYEVSVGAIHVTYTPAAAAVIAATVAVYALDSWVDYDTRSQNHYLNTRSVHAGKRYFDFELFQAGVSQTQKALLESFLGDYVENGDQHDEFAKLKDVRDHVIGALQKLKDGTKEQYRNLSDRSGDYKVDIWVDYDALSGNHTINFVATADGQRWASVRVRQYGLSLKHKALIDARLTEYLQPPASPLNTLQKYAGYVDGAWGALVAAINDVFEDALEYEPV